MFEGWWSGLSDKSAYLAHMTQSSNSAAIKNSNNNTNKVRFGRQMKVAIWVGIKHVLWQNWDVKILELHDLVIYSKLLMYKVLFNHFNKENKAHTYFKRLT
jgi:hypothetical protein